MPEFYMIIAQKYFSEYFEAHAPMPSSPMPMAPRVNDVVRDVGRYAHIEGKKIKKNDKYETKQILVMISCLLFSVAIAFPLPSRRDRRLS